MIMAIVIVLLTLAIGIALCVKSDKEENRWTRDMAFAGGAIVLISSITLAILLVICAVSNYSPLL